MSVSKFHTLEDLKNTGLPMFSSSVYANVNVGDVFLQDRVIGMWDFSDRSELYTYGDMIDSFGRKKYIRYEVRLCKRISDTETEIVPLKKDLSNINYFNLV